MKTKRDWVRLCMMLKELWNVEFNVCPFQDYVSSGKWCVSFYDRSSTRGLPGTFAQYGGSVEEAAEGLLLQYVERYGDLSVPRVRSVEELEAVYAFSKGAF